MTTAYRILAEPSPKENTVSADRIYPKVVVLCTNSEGSPEFHTYTPEVTHRQMIDGEYYDFAKKNAAESGYAEPMIAFDATDATAKQLTQTAAWLLERAPKKTPSSKGPR